MSISDRLNRIDELLDRIGEQEERYQAFLDASPWGILVVDKTFHIVYMNKTLERMSGQSHHELRGQHLHALIPQEDRQVHTQREKEYIAHPAVREGNHGFRPRLLHKDGHVIPVEISLAPTKVQGKTYYFASIRHLSSLLNTVGQV
jgi:PAS domain S-box-containing protein